MYLISGISGAGKTVFMKALEDVGFFCVDNLPIPLIDDFAAFVKAQSIYDRIALVVDIREKEFLHAFDGLIQSILKDRSLSCSIIFLDARDEVLVRRYSETRRLHPTKGHELAAGIEEERLLLKPLRDRADYVVDTSSMTSHQLRRAAEEIALGRRQEQRIAVRIMSFGFKYGVPQDADFIFDMRFLPNPYYVSELSAKTGLDSDVAAYIERQAVAGSFMKRAGQMLKDLLPAFDSEGKNFVTVAFGCTGGRHRSVYAAERLREFLAKTYRDVSIWHRDIDRDAASRKAAAG